MNICVMVRYSYWYSNQEKDTGWVYAATAKAYNPYALIQ